MEPFVFTLFLLVTFCVQTFVRLKPQTQDALIAKAKIMWTSVKDTAGLVRDKIFRRRMSYRQLFLDQKGQLNQAGRIVLADLTKFCRGMTSTTVVSQVSGMVDPHATGLAEGRREVWLKIMKELGVNPMQVMEAMREDDALAA